MGLGSFKALGAAYVIATDAVATGREELSHALAGVTYVTASAGNHGMSVAAGARVFGANAVVYIAETVPDSFHQRLAEKGAIVVREGAEYEASMAAAAEAAEKFGWNLLSDSSWEGYVDVPRRLMEGYLVMVDEIISAMAEPPGPPPSHVFLQAGVGGLAGAAGALMREKWGDAPKIIVVEPEAAPALMESVRAGRPVKVSGPVSSMGRLDCKEPSLIALKGLARDADFFVTISEEEAVSAMPMLSQADLATTPSGGAGIAALLASEPHHVALGIDHTSTVLAILSEEP
jgi:diaminopropionate ammonia-lyase